MTSKPAPGPWTWEFDDFAINRAIPGYHIMPPPESYADIQLFPICTVRRFGNAQLIAAAPELLEALKELRINANRLCDRQLCGTYEDCRRSLKIADSAIKKALGFV